MPSVVTTHALSRSFGQYVAVDHLDLDIDAGEIYGLLGPNGAGKTTTIRMLTTLLMPSSGRARVAGYDVLEDPDAVRARLGYVMQSIPWQVNRLLSAREILEIEAALHHVPRPAIRVQVDEALDLVGLLEHADAQIGTYSGGMHKRLDLACGLLHRPEVLVLDEPTLGLDVQSRHRIWDHITTLQESGVTVLLATNYLDEADRLCDRLTIIDRGREVVTGSPSELKRTVGADVVQVAAADGERLRRVLADAPWMKRVLLTEAGEVHIYVEDAAAALPTLMRLSLDAGIELHKVAYSQPTLDDVFLLHTGRELKETEAVA